MNASALITGAATRIGKEMALGLAEQGINIVIHFMSSEKEAKQVADRARKFGVRAEVIKANLLNDGEVSGLISEASALIGTPLNILINNTETFPDFWDIKKR